MELSKNVLAGRCGSVFWPVLGAILLWIIPSMIPGVNYLMMLVGVYFYIGYMRFHLHVIRNKEYNFNTIWSGFSTHLTIVPLGVGVLTLLATYGGMILLIIPGLYFSIKFSQSSMVMVDNPELGVIEVMKESWRVGELLKVLNGKLLGYFYILYGCI